MEFADIVNQMNRRRIESATAGGSTISGNDLIANTLRRLQPVEPQGALLGYRPSEAQAQADAEAARIAFAETPLGMIHAGVAASNPVRSDVASAGRVAADPATPGKAQATLSGSELILHAMTSAASK